MKLHIHFGIHRTGTTSLHRTLYKNKDLLKEKGILYPDLGVESRHVKLAWQLISKKISYKDAISKIKKEINTDTKLILLSSEDFCLVDIEKWLSMLSNEFELSASVYLKRQDLWLESWYNQHIRWPWNKRLSHTTPTSFLNHISDFHWIDYDLLLTRIEKHIPTGHLYINTIESCSVTNTTEDLLKHVDLILPVEYEKTNASLSSAKLDIIRRIGFLKINKKARRRILNALENLDIKEDNGSKLVFNDKQAKAIMKRYSKSNMNVAKKYFERDKLFNDSYISNRSPSFISDDIAYKKYIPDLLKIMSQD